MKRATCREVYCSPTPPSSFVLPVFSLPTIACEASHGEEISAVVASVGVCLTSRCKMGTTACTAIAACVVYCSRLRRYMWKLSHRALGCDCAYICDGIGRAYALGGDRNGDGAPVPALPSPASMKKATASGNRTEVKKSIGRSPL